MEEFTSGGLVKVSRYDIAARSPVDKADMNETGSESKGGGEVGGNEVLANAVGEWKSRDEAGEGGK